VVQETVFEMMEPAIKQPAKQQAEDSNNRREAHPPVSYVYHGILMSSICFIRFLCDPAIFSRNGKYCPFTRITLYS